MSILKSTHSGKPEYKKISWYKRLDSIIDTLLQMSTNAIDKDSWHMCIYAIPTYSPEHDKYLKSEHLFSFQGSWSKEYFRKKFIERFKYEIELRQKNNKQYIIKTIEDIPLIHPDAKKELPKIGEEVYIKTQLGFNYIGYLKKRTVFPFKKEYIWYLKNNGYASIINPVTYWMPIPETPKGGEI